MSNENQKTILLVEDEVIASAYTAKIINDLGYNVVTADTGEKAVEAALCNKKINLILMDVNLSKGINGSEAAQQILSKKHIPIVFLTSHTEKEMLQKISGVTRYGFLIKNSSELVFQTSIEMAFDLFESNENLRIQHELSLMLNASNELQTALDNVLKILLQLESIDCGGIYLSDPETGALDIAVHYGLSCEFINQVKYFPPDSKSVRMVQSGKAIYGNYNDVRPVTDDVRMKEGLRSIAIIPIMDQGKLVAILNLASHTHESTPSGTRITLEMLAMQIGSMLMMLRTEKKLRENEEHYRAVFENTGSAMLLIEEDMTMSMVNNEFVLRSGYSRDEIIGKMKWTKLVHPDDLDRMIEQHKLRRKSHDAALPGYEFRFRTKSGEIRDTLLTIEIIPGTKKSVASLIDITERRHAEIEKDFLKEQLLQTQKLESLGRLAGGVAHDFNNLLTGILGFSELASFKLPEGHPALDDISMILNAGNKAADLVKQLLAFGRKNKLEFSMIDLNESVKNTAKMLSRLIGDNITMENKISLNMKKVSADSTQISQILINLVINARDAMPDGGVITIETSMETLDEKYIKNFENLSAGEYAVVSVSDTGIGMTKEVQKEIFDPFFTTKEKGKGTGLGLSTVFGIVKQHKGNILVYSEIGKGSTFKIYLPCLENEEMMHDAEIEMKDLHGTESILIVDDNPTPQKVASETLKSQGYIVYNASSGEEALELFENKDFNVDLVISDVVMSGIDGNELADRLSEIRPGIKIILMSGYSNMAVETDKKTGYDFIQKPFTPNYIMNYVRKILNKKK